MTSTSFNVGLNDDTRLSSRVLRPPGGGHTDIFGGEAEIPRGRRAAPAPAGSVFIGDEPAKPAKAAEPSQNGSGEVSTPTAPEESPKSLQIETKAEPQQEARAEPKQESTSKPAEQAKLEAPKRVRVPPGGFSSGLW
ncbi:jupiter microtubule associated homolog 1 [Leptidea sinapis]|uniref:Microtubule-associated protein Jupiter n=1 Tax=Leptidea sinapis TaxID=189913 RepID=A0A5E4QPH2_9NEOP|nr:jupiter microtubule associated homolog 1 [Leptidea sinapis]VVC99552.1 unnamed protein product [Leptidea sinapis]